MKAKKQTRKFVKYITTKSGRRIYASSYGYKAFVIYV